MNVNPLLRFILERHAIYRRKKFGDPKPWTRDKILQRYRFCNVFRELDTVTIWIREHWREPHQDDPDLWFAMVVARLVNWPDSLDAINYPVPWHPERFVRVLEQRKKDGEKCYTGAYMIHAGRDKTSKARYLADKVLTPMWSSRKRIRPWRGDTLASFYARLHSCKDMGSFMAGQVIADLKYAPILRHAKDWSTWAISGPGSKRGLNRVMGRNKKAKWKEADWKECLDELYDKISPKIIEAGLPGMHEQDLQNALCEWDKYERVRLGEGRPRSLYPGIFPDLLSFR